MKSKFRLFRGKSGNYFCEDRQTGRQESLKTQNKGEAERLLNCKNEAQEIPALNIEMAKVYLNAADPTLLKRTWRSSANIEPLNCRFVKLLGNRSVTARRFWGWFSNSHNPTSPWMVPSAG